MIQFDRFGAGRKCLGVRNVKVELCGERTKSNTQMGQYKVDGSKLILTAVDGRIRNNACSTQKTLERKKWHFC